MGKNKRLPEQIAHLDYSMLRNSQIWTLADWMKCRPAVQSCKTAEERRAKLREVCQLNLQHAQEGYDIIVLQKAPNNAAPLAGDIEKRMYEVVTNILVDHKDTLDDNMSRALTAAVDGASAKLVQFAKEQIKLAAETTKPFIVKDGSKMRTVKGVMPKEFTKMVQLATARNNILMVGPAGCGKTYIAAKIAESLGLDFADQSCSAGLSESVFTGWLLPVGKDGTFEYVPSPFINIYENGGVFLFDEMDAADANLLTFLNKALANDSFCLPQRFKKPLVKKHKDFVAVGAANTFGHGADAMYVGRNQLDAATLDRFRTGTIMMDYSAEVESNVGSPALVEWARHVRKGIYEKSLRRVMSTRTIVDMQKMVTMYDWKMDDWNKAYFADWSPEELTLIAPYVANRSEAV